MRFFYPVFQDKFPSPHYVGAYLKKPPEKRFLVSRNETELLRSIRFRIETGPEDPKNWKIEAFRFFPDWPDPIKLDKLDRFLFDERVELFRQEVRSLLLQRNLSSRQKISLEEWEKDQHLTPSRWGEVFGWMCGQSTTCFKSCEKYKERPEQCSGLATHWVASEGGSIRMEEILSVPYRYTLLTFRYLPDEALTDRACQIQTDLASQYHQTYTQRVVAFRKQLEEKITLQTALENRQYETLLQGLREI